MEAKATTHILFKTLSLLTLKCRPTLALVGEATRNQIHRGQKKRKKKTTTTLQSKALP